MASLPDRAGVPDGAMTPDAARVLTLAAVGGVALGVAYTLSPLTVLGIAALGGLVRWAGRGLAGRERRWFLAIVLGAVALRLALVAGLFVAGDATRPYASFFGDEEIFKSRAVWVRNLGLGVPISTADIIYVYDDTARSAHLILLTVLQAVVGDAPYGIHLLNVVLYVGGVLALYRLVRSCYGARTAAAGLAGLLYLPTLMMWSVSALKDPLYVAVAVGELLCAVAVVRAGSWNRRALGAAGVVAGALLLEGLRPGGLIVGLGGTLLGVTAAWVVARPRVAVACAAAAPLVVTALLLSDVAADRLLPALREAARYHSGHVWTPGHTYRLLEPAYYLDQPAIAALTPTESAAFAVRAAGAYLVQPLPWRIESRAMLAYLPEHVLWYAMLVLLPLGVVAGLRRDRLVTALLLSHASLLMGIVALTSGNVGTLVRHRGLVWPYLIWLGVLGGMTLLRAAGGDRVRVNGDRGADDLR